MAPKAKPKAAAKGKAKAKPKAKAKAKAKADSSSKLALETLAMHSESEPSGDEAEEETTVVVAKPLNPPQTPLMMKYFASTPRPRLADKYRGAPQFNPADVRLLNKFAKEANAGKHFVYCLNLTKDCTFMYKNIHVVNHMCVYIGQTGELNIRIPKHLKGEGDKLTNGKGAFFIGAVEVPNLECALAYETRLKEYEIKDPGKEFATGYTGEDDLRVDHWEPSGRWHGYAQLMDRVVTGYHSEGTKQTWHSPWLAPTALEQVCECLKSDQMKCNASYEENLRSWLKSKGVGVIVFKTNAEGVYKINAAGKRIYESTVVATRPLLEIKSEAVAIERVRSVAARLCRLHACLFIQRWRRQYKKVRSLRLEWAGACMFQCWAEYTFSFRPKYTAKFGLFSEVLTRNWHLKAFVPFYLLSKSFKRAERREVVERWRVGPVKLGYPLQSFESLVPRAV
jgi:predicted GIY-YIG superfamily endonuclease